MKPIEFSEQTSVFARDQSEYQPLPARVSSDGVVTSCWGLTWRERWRVLITGRIYCAQLTFNQPLQPQLLTVELDAS